MKTWHWENWCLQFAGLWCYNRKLKNSQHKPNSKCLQPIPCHCRYHVILNKQNSNSRCPKHLVTPSLTHLSSGTSCVFACPCTEGPECILFQWQVQRTFQRTELFMSISLQINAEQEQSHLLYWVHAMKTSFLCSWPQYTQKLSPLSDTSQL